MLPKQDNEIITRVGPGTAMGNLIRQYWLPAMMSAELPSPDCPPLRVRLLGENLIAFRTTSGAVGVMQNSCPHRGASMFFGRNEEEGLRCVYHGWKFDTAGNCVDMPSEPAESNFRMKVHALAYPTQERGGLIWVYMGPRSEPPPLPELAANMLPEGEYHIGAYSSECNWLQSLEGDYDTIHVGFLHRGSIQPDEGSPPDASIDPTLDYYALKNRWARLSVAETPFGCSAGINRPAEEGTTYWRIAHYLFPFYSMIPASFTNLAFIAVVPVDDENCVRFHINRVNPNRPRPTEEFVDGLPTGYHSNANHNGTGWLDRFRLAGNSRNDYLIDRAKQASNQGPLGYSGIPGRGQDGAVTESMGIIYQRDNEHLGVTDAGIIRMRRLLIRHAKALRDSGVTPPGVDQPGLYRVKSVCTILPDGVEGIGATQAMQWENVPETVRVTV